VCLGSDDLSALAKRSHVVLRPSERTPFYEPYSGKSFLYLARFTTTAVSGTYRIWVSGSSSSTVQAVVGVGYREVPGTVRP
jgi:hypothetical protein